MKSIVKLLKPENYPKKAFLSFPKWNKKKEFLGEQTKPSTDTSAEKKETNIQQVFFPHYALKSTIFTIQHVNYHWTDFCRTMKKCLQSTSKKNMLLQWDIFSMGSFDKV